MTFRQEKLRKWGWNIKKVKRWGDLKQNIDVIWKSQDPILECSNKRLLAYSTILNSIPTPVLTENPGKSQSFIDWTSLVEKSWNHREANSINARPLWAGLMNDRMYHHLDCSLCISNPSKIKLRINKINYHTY